MIPVVLPRVFARVSSTLTFLLLASGPALVRAQAPEAAVLRGRVTDQGAQPIHDASVTLAAERPLTTRTLGDGRYQLSVPPSDSARSRVGGWSRPSLWPSSPGHPGLQHP